MAALKRTLTFLLILAITAFGAALAQDDQADKAEQAEQAEGQTRTIEIEGEEVAPLGEIHVGESRAYDAAETTTVEVEVETGAIVFTAESPEDQRPNIDLVGPNGFYERFEVEGDAEGEHIVEGLLPGVYSVAASDEGLQIAHSVVEVKSAEAASVHIALQELAAYEQGTFVADERATFPNQSFETAEAQPLENADFGEVTVETENEDARFVVTGPNGYSQEFTGSFTASDLSPGVYVIAGTLDNSYVLQGRLGGAEIATSAVEVNVSQTVTMVPVYDFTGAETQEVEAEVEGVEDVAGGGEAEQVKSDEVDTDVETDVVETEEAQTEEEEADDAVDSDEPADGEDPNGETEEEQEEGQY